MSLSILFILLVPSLHNIQNQVRYYNWIHLATCFGLYPAIPRSTRNSVIKVYSTSIFSNWIPLFTLKTLSLRNSMLMVKMLLYIKLSVHKLYKLLKLHFVEMDVCRTVAHGSTYVNRFYIYIYIYIYIYFFFFIYFADRASQYIYSLLSTNLMHKIL